MTGEPSPTGPRRRVTPDGRGRRGGVPAGGVWPGGTACPVDDGSLLDDPTGGRDHHDLHHDDLAALAGNAGAVGSLRRWPSMWFGHGPGRLRQSRRPHHPDRGGTPSRQRPGQSDRVVGHQSRWPGDVRSERHGQRAQRDARRDCSTTSTSCRSTREASTAAAPSTAARSPRSDA